MIRIGSDRKPQADDIRNEASFSLLSRYREKGVRFLRYLKCRVRQNIHPESFPDVFGLFCPIVNRVLPPSTSRFDYFSINLPRGLGAGRMTPSEMIPGGLCSPCTTWRCFSLAKSHARSIDEFIAMPIPPHSSLSLLMIESWDGMNCACSGNHYFHHSTGSLMLHN